MAVGDQVGSQIMTDPGPGSSAGNGTLGSNMNSLGMLFQQLQNQNPTASQQASAPKAAPADPWGGFGTTRETDTASPGYGNGQVRSLSLDQLNNLISSGGWNNQQLNSMMWSQPTSSAEESGTYTSPADPSFINMYDKLGGTGWGSDAGRHGVQYDEFRQGLRDYQGQWGNQTKAPPSSAPTPTPLSGPVGTNFVHLNPLPYLNSMSTSPTPGSSVPNNTLTQISGSPAGSFGSLNPNPGEVDWSKWMNGAGPTGANNY